ncbi:uncharacterized protein LOC102677736 isoform X1 [Apis dorsata]|uniref:uncharacterized protein LOC102677736 isoform X1 n=1 Tax=Apis dorsata TaxID=7462 RepID=UPI0003DF4D1F|nr:uncharacterized protein LOC102677736 isoform X1 [Apis dorsata]
MTLMFQRLLRDNSGAYNCSFDYLLFSKILFYVNCVVCRLNEESKRIPLKNAGSDNCMVRDQEVYFHRRLYRSFAEKEISGLLSMNGQHSHGMMYRWQRTTTALMINSHHAYTSA